MDVGAGGRLEHAQLEKVYAGKDFVEEVALHLFELFPFGFRGEEVDLEIGKAGNNTVTSAESLAGKTLKLTFTGTETAIKCKAEIVE